MDSSRIINLWLAHRREYALLRAGVWDIRVVGWVKGSFAHDRAPALAKQASLVSGSGADAYKCKIMPVYKI